MHFRHWYLRSPDGEGGGGGAKTYTEDEVAQIKENSYRGGYSAAKNKALTPFLNLAREKGFEGETFDEIFDSVLGTADVGRKQTKASTELDRQLQKVTAERDAFATRFKGTVINSAIADLAKNSTNPTQVARLLQLDYKFEADENGKVSVLNLDGTPAMKDSYTSLSLGDVVEKFHKENPHFVSATAKAAVGTGAAKTGAPETMAETDPRKIATKEMNTWSAAERKIMVPLMKAGKVELVGNEIKVHDSAV